MKLYLPLFLIAALLVGGCNQKPPAAEPSRTPPRTEYSPEEFGIGRKHTKSAACNRQIDQLLDQARVCYVARPMSECETLQRDNTAKIARLKNSSRCSH